MSLPSLHVLRLTAALTLGAATAHAAADGMSASLSGFGTLGIAHSSERQADFSTSVLKASGAGYSNAYSRHVDSRLGAQLDLALARRWSAVLQVVSEQQLDRSYRPQVEWANVKYQVTPDLALRAGRIALPIFLAADYRKVGYAYPWTRQPVEIYGAMPLASSDGADLTWRWELGRARLSTQAFFGHTDKALGGGVRLQARRIEGFSQGAEWGPVTVRLSALAARVTVNVGTRLFDAFQGLGAAGDAISDQYELDDKRSRIIGAGLSVDPGDWFATCEVAHTHSNSFLGSTTAMYAGAGARFGAFTPYAGYTRVRADSPTSDDGVPVDGLAPPRALAAKSLNASLNSLLRTIPVQSTVSLGSRWDVRRNVALKLQLDRVTPHAGSRGTLINTRTGFKSGRTLQVSSATLDFVF